MVGDKRQRISDHGESDFNDNVPTWKLGELSANEVPISPASFNVREQLRDKNEPSLQKGAPWGTTPSPTRKSERSPRSPRLTGWQMRELEKASEWSTSNTVPSPTIDMLERPSWGGFEHATQGRPPTVPVKNEHAKQTQQSSSSPRVLPAWQLREQSKHVPPMSPQTKIKCIRQGELDPSLPPFFRVVCSCTPDQRLINRKKLAQPKPTHCYAESQSTIATQLPPLPPPPPPLEMSPDLAEICKKALSLSHPSIHSTTSSCDCSHTEEATETSYLSDDESEFETSSVSTCEIDCARLEVMPPEEVNIVNEKRFVDFAEMKHVIIIPSVEDIQSDDEDAKKSIWWGRDDLQLIRSEVNEQADRLNKGEVGSGGDATCCTRGLEGLMDKISKQRKKTRSIVIRAVLETQRYQRNKHGEVLNPELIAEICIKCSAKSQIEAQELARRDAEEVRVGIQC